MSTQNPNWPLSCWQASFTTGLKGPAPASWDDLTDRVTAYATGAGTQFELDVVESQPVEVTVRNADEALNPANTGSPYNSGGKSLKPFRRIRHWAAWPLTGNLLNATNDDWVTSGSLADTAGFESGTVGTWTATAGAAVANSTARAHTGTRSMLITWATTAGGASVAEATATGVPLKAGATYTASAWVWIGSGPAVTLAAGGQLSTSTATASAWQRVTVTFTATEGVSTSLRVYASAATTSGQQVWVDDVQLEATAAASAFTTSGPTIYPLLTGYIERYPLTWRHQGFEGWAQLTVVDALAALSRLELEDVLTQDVLQDSPVFLWPLRDEAGSAVAANHGRAADQAGLMALSPAGTPASVTTVFGEPEGPGVDAPACLRFAPSTAYDTYPLLVDWYGHSLYTLGGTTAGYTLECWFSAGGSARQMRVARLWADPDTQEELAVDILAGGQVRMRHLATGGGADTTVTTVGGYADEAWHHVACTATAAGGTVTESLWVDGQLAGSATRAGAATMTARGLMLGHDHSAGGDSFSGRLAMAAAYAGAIAAARIRSHWLAGRTGHAGDTTGQRIARILAWAGWQGDTVLPDGASRHGPAVGLAGTSALAACQVAAATEHGAFLADPLGRLKLVPRDAYHAQTSGTATFGEDETGGEVPYLDAAAELDSTFVYSKVTVTRAGGIEQTVVDTTSAEDHGDRSVNLSTTHATDDDAGSFASYLALQYADARLRIPELSINPAANPALWPVALSLQFGDRVTWRRRTSAGVTVELDGFVSHVAHEVDPLSDRPWVAKFLVSPTDTYQAGLIGDPVYGLVGSTFISTY